MRTDATAIETWPPGIWAFASMAFIQGQIVGKLWMTVAALLVVLTLRRLDERRAA